jgi:hypothetical protein
MPRHGPLRSSRQRNTAGTRSKRLCFESLERRNLLSAIGVPMMTAPASLAPPAHVGELQAWRVEPANIVLADGASLETSNLGSLANMQGNMPLHVEDAVFHADPDHLDLLPGSVANLSISSITLPGNITVSQSIVTSFAGQTFLFVTISAPRLTILESGSSATSAISIGEWGVAYSFVVELNAGSSASQPEFLPNAPSSAGNGSGDAAVISQGVRSESAAGVDVSSAAAARGVDISSQSSGPGTNGLATDGGEAALASLVSQFDSTTRGNSADTALFSYSDSGFAVVDAALSAAPRSSDVTGAPTDIATEGLDAGGLAGDVSPGAHKSLAASDGAGRPVSVSMVSIVAGESAPSRGEGEAGVSTSMDARGSGIVELAVATPSIGALDDAAVPAVHHAGDARPESEVGLYCDMEVGVATPAGDAAVSAAQRDADSGLHSAYLNAGGRDDDARAHETLKRANSRREASGEPADGVTLLLGAALVVITDRIRLKRDQSDGQQPLPAGDRLRNEPRI